LKTLTSFAMLSLVMVGSSAIAKDAGSLDPTGTWLTEDGRAKVRIEKCGADHANICGNVVWLKDPLDEHGKPKTDEKNPDPAKRSRPALGMPLFIDLKPDDEQVYSGEIYNAENGKNYDVTFQVDKPADLHVKGCMLSILCGSQHWSRVADVPTTVVAQGKTKPK
jgi:uncharacterized protein (DUF2147 family)